MSYLHNIETVQSLLQDKDHFDVKVIEGDVTLREFIVAALMYYPAWMKALYTIRRGFVHLLGMTQESIPKVRMTPETVPFQKGEWITFFQVYDARENDYWIASASDKHLDAYIIVANEILENGQTRFHLATIVHYKNWAGPVYFNVIRPFHHIVVSSMMKAAVHYQATKGDLNYA